jgi:hypothetical protein
MDEWRPPLSRVCQMLSDCLPFRINQNIDDWLMLIACFNKEKYKNKKYYRTWPLRVFGLQSGDEVLCLALVSFSSPGQTPPWPLVLSAMRENREGERGRREREERVRPCRHHRSLSSSSAALFLLRILVRHHILSMFLPSNLLFPISIHGGHIMFARR